MHLKRERVPKTWPITRKGTKYLVRPNSNLEFGIPILIVLRDMLKLAKNRKEVKKILHQKQVLLNGKIPRDEKNSLTLFDVLSITPMKKSYKLSINEKGKFFMQEIPESEKTKKVSKIIGKKTLKGKKIQLNLMDGRNIISDLKCNVGDSIVLDFDSKKALKCIELKENSKAFAFGGKHSGAEGIIKNIEDKHKILELESEDGKLNVLIKHLLVVE